MIIFSFLRSLVGVFLFAALTLFFSILLILESFTLSSRAFEDAVIQRWGAWSLALFGVSLNITGKENIPAGNCLFLFNHASFFDIFAMYAAYPHFRFGAKIELFAIPLFGMAMTKMGALPIARQNRHEVMKVYEVATQRAAAGEKFALSPEGGRSYEEKLLPFKAGPFLFAINAGMPIVPVVVRGAKDVLGKGGILPNWNRWSSVIHVDFLPMVSVSGKTDENKKELQQTVFQMMNERLQKIS